jgi:two-component system chemotaxis sensor kinase CheA
MDVVKTSIEKIGGSVDLETAVGHGTTVRIKIPLTLAIIQALIVASRGERFAVPLRSLLELIRLEGDEVRTGIEHVGGAVVHRLRGNLLPLINLATELELDASGATSGRSDGAVNIIVLQAEDHPFGLVVDQIQDTEEIVVKPLGKRLRSIPIYAGGTIMGDGKIALILDVGHLARRASVISEQARSALPLSTAVPAATRPVTKALLLFRSRDGRRMAIPLSEVARLEELPRADVEAVGHRPVIQYRGHILPLIFVEDLVGEHRGEQERGRSSEIDGTDHFRVVVHSIGDRSIGLVVDQILMLSRSLSRSIPWGV